MKPKKVYFFVIRLWERSQDFSHLYFYEKLIFFLLCFCEIFYKVGFSIVIKIKKIYGQKKVKSRVIGVGNLSVGGTGKSVFVSYLVKKLGAENCTVLMRGYGKKRGDASDLGDEAMMLSRGLGVTVLVGSNRALSAKLVDTKNVILDDAYQNFQLKKDLEILLIDARAPFGNGHCLPAGPLREKDFSRADIVVVTHADEAPRYDACGVTRGERFRGERFRGERFRDERPKVFYGQHAAVGPRGNGKRVLAVAGIGSFSGFITSCKKHDFEVCGTCEYVDHHAYTKKDVSHMIKQMTNFSCDAIITTSKDWQKLELLVGENKKLFLVLEIEFKFLSGEEEERFLDGFGI